ncbi:hypothetical protein FA95DRAFT_1613772 [Auriscalpium vulgare]|uniref:Uncharacterized protein n=1 Tax=Auriscalpium vulgare TaxID=40419 RepID=A0ACB8R2S6_9AGAM|nr:hypothetical protein FA95DRAFT_1613772 [Auriscalpium vulgare]
MGNAGVTADIVWSACAEPFLTSLDFLDELVQLIEPANSHENPETSLDCRERLSLGLRLGPFGLQAAVNGLDILYNLLPETNPGITRGTYDVRLKVLTHTSETALRLLTDFLCSFPRHMYDPPGLRAVGVLLDRNKTKSTFSDADEEDWSKLTVPNLVLKRADPSALKHALEQDYGHWSDHSAMRYNAMYCGEHGLDGLITRVVHPFLDEFPIEHPHYAEFFEIFEGFFRAVDHKLTNHKKSHGKNKATTPQSEPPPRKHTRSSHQTDSNAHVSDGTEGKRSTRSGTRAQQARTEKNAYAKGADAAPNSPINISSDDDADAQEDNSTSSPVNPIPERKPRPYAGGPTSSKSDATRSPNRVLQRLQLLQQAKQLEQAAALRGQTLTKIIDIIYDQFPVRNAPPKHDLAVMIPSKAILLLLKVVFRSGL